MVAFLAGVRLEEPCRLIEGNRMYKDRGASKPTVLSFWRVAGYGKPRPFFVAPIQNWPICPISALHEKFNPRNIPTCLRLNFTCALISNKFA